MCGRGRKKGTTEGKRGPPHPHLVGMAISLSFIYLFIFSFKECQKDNQADFQRALTMSAAPHAPAAALGAAELCCGVKKRCAHQNCFREKRNTRVSKKNESKKTKSGIYREGTWCCTSSSPQNMIDSIFEFVYLFYCRKHSP